MPDFEPVEEFTIRVERQVAEDGAEHHRAILERPDEKPVVRSAPSAQEAVANAYIVATGG